MKLRWCRVIQEKSRHTALGTTHWDEGVCTYSDGPATAPNWIVIRRCKDTDRVITTLEEEKILEAPRGQDSTQLEHQHQK